MGERERNDFGMGCIDVGVLENEKAKKIIQQIVFYFNAALLLISALMVITSRNPVRGVLSLVLAFFAASVLWMLMQAEFLSLVLIFVYVGAVMTLFLFVVMMLNIDKAPAREKFVRYFPFGLLIILVLVGMLIVALNPTHFDSQNYTLTLHGANYSNVKSLGAVLYTQYMYPFEIAAALLLVAIIAAINLAFHGSGKSKRQDISQQLAARKKDRMQLIDLKADKP